MHAYSDQNKQISIGIDLDKDRYIHIPKEKYGWGKGGKVEGKDEILILGHLQIKG
jgi:hypothetical protein